MPTYEYECEACSHNFDEFQSMSEEPLTKCPKCGKKKLRRVYGAGAAILFKGSGFYCTDYRSDSYKSAAKADKESTGGDKAGKSDTNSSADKGSSAKSEKKSSQSSP